MTAPANNFAIETSHLRKEFGRKVAVADLTLQVARGEVFGFLGPNGAGKTTSIKMLLGLTQPTAGTARLLGESLGNHEVRRQIGFLPEHFRFYHWLRADEFMDLQGQLYGMSASARATAVPRMLKRVGLGDRADTKLAAFSKGMSQRIGLAQALMNNPQLVFLDEPTSGLDPLGRKLVREIITELRDQGTAVFLNSHLLSEVEQTCDRVAFIRDGRILETHDLHAWPDEVVAVLLRLGEVTPEVVAHCTALAGSCEPGRHNTLHLTLAQEALIPPLVNWLSDNGHSVFELRVERMSLEDRFLRIIGESSGDVT